MTDIKKNGTEPVDTEPKVAYRVLFEGTARIKEQGIYYVPEGKSEDEGKERLVTYLTEELGWTDVVITEFQRLDDKVRPMVDQLAAEVEEEEKKVVH